METECSGPTALSYCDFLCDCFNCSDAQQADCVETIQNDLDEAEAKGCAKEAAATLHCRMTMGMCLDMMLSSFTRLQ